jgi:single-strand DNA-binding protein
MILTGICRLGRDAELRYTTDGTPVANFSAAWNYGRKGDDGKRPSQWVELSLWGDRAEKLEQYLTKGAALCIVASDVHVETFEKRDGGTGAKLVGRVDSIEFAGGQREEGGGEQRSSGRAPMPAPNSTRSTPAPAAKPAARTGTGFDDMDSDIPFASPHAEHDPMIVDRKARRTRLAR